MRVGNLALKILIAISLCWILFAQDQTAVFDSDPTSDLPEMMTSVAINLKLPEQQLALPAPPIALAQTAPRSIANDNFPRAYTAPPIWRLNNPPTAPPAV
jgi:hypothetical protein